MKKVWHERQFKAPGLSVVYASFTIKHQWPHGYLVFKGIAKTTNLGCGLRAA